jgi:hypothetical protein
MHAVVVLEQVLRREGRTASFKVEQTWKFAFDATNDVETIMESTVRGPRGTRRAEPISGAFTLDEPRQVRSRGGGEALLTFEDGSLTFVRTLQSGAYRAKFAIARGANGLTCSAAAAFARERGGAIRFESPFGGQITVLNSKQISSTCRVAKR